jgi:uncharacterized membrane protein
MSASESTISIGSVTGLLASGFKYNLQVLPDVLMSASILFSILFQSPPLATLGVAMVALSFIHKGTGRFIGSMMPGLSGANSNTAECSGRFPGATYQSLLGLQGGPIFGASESAVWPSYYSTFMGFLAGWIGTLPALYSRELVASPERGRSATGGIALLAILLFIVMIYRIVSECEGFASISVGLLIGFGIGLGLVLLASWLTDRRATNILGLPLIRGKTAKGEPIYVCERPNKK